MADENRPARRFPFDAEFDFGLRPASYWPDVPTEADVLATIKGTARRDIARRALEGEELVRVGDDDLYRGAMELVLQDALTDEQRQRWGSVHPAMMSGEYLPDREEGEVEIARISLASTTGDVIQVLARADGDRIAYRVVDEYWDEGSSYEITPATSLRPLTFGELIDLIDTTRRASGHSYGDDRYDVGLIDGVREANLDYGADPEEMRWFFELTSPFYPQLHAYYDQRSAAAYEAWEEENARLNEDYDRQRALFQRG